MVAASDQERHMNNVWSLELQLRLHNCLGRICSWQSSGRTQEVLRSKGINYGRMTELQQISHFFTWRRHALNSDNYRMKGVPSLEEPGWHR